MNASRFPKNRSKQSTHDVYIANKNANIANVRVCVKCFPIPKPYNQLMLDFHGV